MQCNGYYLHINAFNLLMYSIFTGTSSRVFLVTEASNIHCTVSPYLFYKFV